MKIVMTIPEAKKLLSMASKYTQSKRLAEKLTLTNAKCEIIYDILADAMPADSFKVAETLGLAPKETEILLRALHHILKMSVTQLAFANEYDDEGVAYPMLYLNIGDFLGV